MNESIICKNNKKWNFALRSLGRMLPNDGDGHIELENNGKKCISMKQFL